MSEPEISRRCPACGVSIRDKALFCPQCGRQLQEGNENETAALHDTHDIVRDVTLTEADFQAQPQPKNPPVLAAPPTQPAQPAKPKKQQTQRARGEVGARIQRATEKARGVEENVAQRVQKFREISSVVIDRSGLHSP